MVQWAMIWLDHRPYGAGNHLFKKKKNQKAMSNCPFVWHFSPPPPSCCSLSVWESMNGHSLEDVVG
jgi:hypothetical protein